MSIRCLKRFDLDATLGQVRSIPVSLHPGKEDAILFVYSAEENLDPWEEAFHFPKDTLKMALYTQSGDCLWKRDMGTGSIPGIWFFPFFAFDLNGDGVDEIWIVNNHNPALPLTRNFRYLERLNPFTGETEESWRWPVYTRGEELSHMFRFFIAGGYVHGEPVLVTCQGTYRKMYLQAYNRGMEKRWEIMIPPEDGPRSSHVCPVWDWDGDGIDELFWGERLLSLDDGHEVLCCDRERYLGHSDIIIPLIHPETEKRYLYTCREGHERPGEKRVVLFDEQGQRVWGNVESGHMHKGWAANIGANGEKIVMAMRLDETVTASEMLRLGGEEFYYDAFTGAPVKPPFSVRGSEMLPLDTDGDGYHEFFGVEGEQKGWFLDRFGNRLVYAGGEPVNSGKMYGLLGEQMMVFHPTGAVEIWGDEEAIESPAFLKRHSYGYHSFGQRLMGTGYNHFNGVYSCGL